MTIASEITKLNTNLTNAYTAVDDKGGTLPQAQNFDNLATAISSIPSGESSGKYQLIQRISDDNGNEIGTVSGFFTDSNDVEYAVVCLDAQYRLASGAWCSNTTAVTNMPLLDSWTSSWPECRDTATQNTTWILDFCTAQSATSTACTHCRSKSFTIDGITYYGQLPNMKEVVDIRAQRGNIENADTSASSYSSLNFSSLRRFIWSSNQYNAGFGICINDTCFIDRNSKSLNFFVVPVLEIPNN